MKKILVLMVAILLSASMAWGVAFVNNDQFQTQADGGFAGVAPGFASGQIAGAAGFQAQEGFGIATPGDIAYDWQTNQQTQDDGVFADDGAGTFAGSRWSTNQNEFAGGVTAGGFYGYNQSQAQVGGSAGVTAGGQFGVAGSAYIGTSDSEGLALGASATVAGQYQTYEGEYVQQSVSPNGGYVFQSGQQYAGTGSFAGATIIGSAYGGGWAAQAGGTVVANDGQGTVMTGQGTAVGAAGGTSGAAGLAVGGGGGFATQQHSYEQFNTSADGTSQQFQTGTVGTIVTGGAISVGP